MTRETKIGLLVGLAFVIVAGILFSDYIRATGQPPEAALGDAGPIARQAIDSPGTSQPPIRLVLPQESTPRQSVPTRDELTRAPSPVIPSNTYAVAQSQNPPSPDHPATNDLSRQPTPAVEDHGADAPLSNLNSVAARNGEPLVRSNLDGSPRNSDLPAAKGPREYEAQPGDTLSRMAARLMGANTKANRQAIIAANPSLQDDPDQIIAGQTYLIPVKGQAVADAANSDTPAVAPRESAPVGEYFYTVKENDSLWRIANDELGDPSAVAAIKELNAGVLKGDNHETVIPGMRLRLPAKPVASAN